MVKEQINIKIKTYIYGLLSGIFISGIFLLFISKNSQIKNNFQSLSNSDRSLLANSNKPITCVNRDQTKKGFQLVNINVASVDDLKSLSGIGDVKAKSIIAWRDKYGNFKNITELMYISGISDTLFQQICNQIKIEK